MSAPATKGNLSFSPFLDKLREVRAAPRVQQTQTPAAAPSASVAVLRDLKSVPGGEEYLDVLMKKSGLPLMEFATVVRGMEEAELVEIVSPPGGGERIRLTATGSTLVDIL